MEQFRDFAAYNQSNEFRVRNGFAGSAIRVRPIAQAFEKNENPVMSLAYATVFDSQSISRYFDRLPSGTHATRLRRLGCRLPLGPRRVRNCGSIRRRCCRPPQGLPHSQLNTSNIIYGGLTPGHHATSPLVGRRRSRRPRPAHAFRDRGFAQDSGTLSWPSRSARADNPDHPIGQRVLLGACRR